MSHKLLLADDSQTIQRVVELTFANEDIDVVTVGDGAQAIEAIERDDPDIVLADVSMPGKNGYDVASFVRGDSLRAGIPVVLLTGAFEPLDEQRCDAIGRHEVLVKPFEPREIIGKVRELLELSAEDTADAPAVAAASVEQATTAIGEDASHETPADADEAPAGVPSEASVEDDVEAAEAAGVSSEASVKDEVEAAEAAVVNGVDAEATDAVGAAARDASAEAGTEPPSVDEDVGSEEAPSAEDETGPVATAAAVAVAVEAAPGERSASGSSDSPPALEKEDAASRSAAVDASLEVAAADPDRPPAPLPEQSIEDEAFAPPAAQAVPGGAGRLPSAGAGGSVLAQSFVTFLAVEQGATPPELPVADAVADSGDTQPLLPEAVMDDLVGRVVERLTDTVLRDTVAEVVARIAERLAREEITRVPSAGE